MAMLDWFNEKENRFFAYHAVIVAVLAFGFEALAPNWATFTFPAIILLAAANFMWNYPVQAIKSHGLFAGTLIEQRILWLVIMGVGFEFLALRWVQNRVNLMVAAVAIGLGLGLAFAAHSRLHSRIVESRGFK